MCILKLAQKRPWLYITYWNSLPNHHSFSHFEPELCSSLQFGWSANAEVLCVIYKSFPIKKKNNPPTNQRIFSQFLTISSLATMWLRLSSPALMVWTPHIALEEFSCARAASRFLTLPSLIITKVPVLLVPGQVLPAMVAALILSA